MLRESRLKSHYTTLFQQPARLAQSAERETLNLKVAGSTPALGFSFCFLPSFFFMWLPLSLNCGS